MGLALYIYMERNKSFRHAFFFFFLNYKAADILKTIFYFKHLPSIASFYLQNIISLTKIFGKRKYYRELISYEQCRLARIINKGGWVVVS